MPSQFLTDEEYALFTAHFQPRHVKSADGKSETLDVAVASLLAGRSKRDDEGLGLHQAARVIQGHRNDGLSWLCERLAEVVLERAPRLTLFTFKGQRAVAGLPEIVQYVKLNPALRVFARAKLYDSHVLRRVVIASSVVLLAVALTLIADQLRPSTSPRGGLTTGLIITVLGVVISILTNHVRLGGSSEDLTALAKHIDEESARAARGGGSSDAIRQAVNSIALRFHGLARPACIIVDHSARLDAFTQAVLDKALRAGVTEGRGRVFWLVVEQREAGVLSRELAVRPSARSEYAGGRIELLQLDPFTVEENEAILRSNNLPVDRARDGLFVKQLVRGANSAEIEHLKTILDALAQSEASEAGLRGSTLLRLVAANSDPPGFERSPSQYESIFSERTAEGKRRLFPIVMNVYLGVPHIPKERVKELLAGLQTQARLLFPAASPIAPLRVPAISRDALKQWPITQLPVETIEWFWFLWWVRALPPQTASTSDLLKLAHHARSAKLDRRLMLAAEGPPLARETVIALMHLTDACVQATLFVDALSTAKALLVNIRDIQAVGPAHAEAMTDQTWISLTRICWQVYLATGDESFLVHLLSLLSDATFVPHAVAPRDIVTPFLRVMNTASDDLDAMGQALQQLLTRDAYLAKRLRVYMQWRTLDVVLLCEACSVPSLVVRAGLPSASAVVESIDRQELIEICDGIYKDAERRFTILDHLVLREALRHTVRTRDVQTLREILPAFVLAAGQGKDRTQTAGTRMSLLERAFQLQTIAVGLDAVLKLAVVAAAPHGRAQYQHRSSSDDLAFRTNLAPGEVTRDLQDLLVFALETVGGRSESLEEHEAISPRVFALVNQLFLHAALAWEELGLAPLRDRMMMDRAQYLFEFADADPKHPETFRTIIESLGPALSAPGVQAVLNHVELAEFFAPVAQLRSVYVTEAVTRLLKLGVASDIALLFCMFLNHIPNASKVETLGAVDHVVKLLSDRQFRVHFVDQFGDDDETGALINTLLRAGVSFGGPDLRRSTDRLAKELAEEPKLAPGISREIQTLRQLYSDLESSGPLSDADIGTALAAWSDRRDHWAYPAVLNHVLKRRPDADNILEASLALLERGGSIFRGSPAIGLALTVGAIVAERGDQAGRQRSLKILRESVVPRAGDWAIEEAERTFTLLAMLDPDNASSHVSHLANWTQLRLERDRAEAFTQMLHEGHFFGVFRSYWTGLSIYRLPTVVLDKGWLTTAQHLPDSNQAAAVDHCLRRMREAVPPLVSRPGNVASVVLDFVKIGMVLFGPDVPAGHEVDIARQQLNKATAEDLRAFLEIIEMSETVPSTLREFIRDHRKFITEELAKQRSAA